jgi:hypothetical protein
MNLCLRLGDRDDYHNLDDLYDVVEHLRMHNVTTPLVPYSRYGVTTDGYMGNNHISLYWGDHEVQPIRELTMAELDEINRRLAR